MIASVVRLAELRFLRLQTLNRCLLELRMRHPGDIDALVSELSNGPDAVGFLVMPELGQWLDTMDRMIRTWADFPSRIASLRRHIERFYLLALPLLARRGRRRIEVTLSGRARLDFPSEGFSVRFSADRAGIAIPIEADGVGVALPDGRFTPWSGCDDPDVTRHYRLSTGIRVREAGDLDSVTPERAMIHRPPFGCSPGVPAWIDECCDALERGRIEMLPHCFRIVIDRENRLGPAAGIARIHPQMTLANATEEVARAVRALEADTECTVPSETVAEPSRQLEAQTFAALERAADGRQWVVRWEEEGDLFRTGYGYFWLGDYRNAEVWLTRAARTGLHRQRAAELVALALRHQFKSSELERALFSRGER